jgi:uncharacterized damage-inducible protein DinB
MDLLDRLLGHDAWTTQQLLVLCRDLTDEELDRDFDIGHRTVRETFGHIIRNVEGWSDLMAGRPERDEEPGPRGSSISALTAQFEVAAAEFATIARAVAERGAWDEKWVRRPGNPPDELTYGGTIAHVITHSMHHRAQLLYMLRRLGVENRPEGDVLSWEYRADKPG